jgi:hypothetical protein
MKNNDEAMNAAGAAEDIIANPQMGGGDGEGQETDTQTKKPHIDLEAGIERMRNLLKEVESVAMSALCSQPETACECWRHLSKAVSDIRKELRPKAGTLAFEDEWAWYGKQIEELRSRMDPTASSGAFFTNDETLKAVAEEMKESPAEGEEFEKKAIGNFAGQGKVTSYAIDRDITVTLTAKMIGDRVWEFKGIKNGDMFIMGSVFGGKWQAMQYCKFIRNGIVSRANSVKTHHKNAALRRAERAADVATGAQSAPEAVASEAESAA